MARWYRFRVVDCTRHCGMPIKTACIVWAIFTACSSQWPLLFLPVGAAIPLMIAAGAIGVVGILAAVTGLRCFTILYLIGATLMEIPILVVIGYTSYALAAYHDQCFDCRSYGNFRSSYGYCSEYVTSLCFLTNGTLWSGLIVAFIACIFTGISLGGFRKLRIHQMGATRVVQTNHHHHHHPQPVVVTQAQPTVYTVPTTTYVTGGVVQQQGAAVYVQQQPGVYPQQQGVYPQMQPPMYTPQAQVQPVDHNPPYNPTF